MVFVTRLLLAFHKKIYTMIKKTSVKLREKLLSNGDKSYYLDIYNEGKRSYEFLNKYHMKGDSKEIRSANKETKLIAQAIRNNRERELITGEYNVKTKLRLNESFISYFKDYKDNYNKKNYRVIDAVYLQFVKFIEADDLTFNQLTPQLLRKFKEFLTDSYKGETPSNYFQKFKRVVQRAYHDEYLIKDPSVGMHIKRHSEIKKEVLTNEEIQLLANTPCGNNEVKRAFLFSCYAGLRFCDTKKLTFDNIKGDDIKIIQSKTGGEVIIPISQTLEILIGKRNNKNELVFKLPSANATNDVLKNWVKKADIYKKITFHCSRHSMATNLLLCETNLFVASELLGHRDIRQTQKYVRIARMQKLKAANNLPKLIFQNE